MVKFAVEFWWKMLLGRRGKDPHPQDKIQHLVFTKDPRPLYYKTLLCILPQKCL